MQPICELAGIDHRVEDIAPSDDPELARVFGPTLVAIAAKAASDRAARRSLPESKTYKRLGYDPISLDEGLRATMDWLRPQKSARSTDPATYARARRLLRQLVVAEELPHRLVGVDEDDPRPTPTRYQVFRGPVLYRAPGQYVPGSGESPQRHLAPDRQRV